MSLPIFSYDRHMKAIVHGSIVRFRDKYSGNQRVGHVWRHRDGSWNVSFNHTYSETGQGIEHGDNYRVIGNVEINPDDENLLEFNVELPHFLAPKGSWGNQVVWTPYPRWSKL